MQMLGTSHRSSHWSCFVDARFVHADRILACIFLENFKARAHTCLFSYLHLAVFGNWSEFKYVRPSGSELNARRSGNVTHHKRHYRQVMRGQSPRNQSSSRKKQFWELRQTAGHLAQHPSRLVGVL